MTATRSTRSRSPRECTRGDGSRAHPPGAVRRGARAALAFRLDRCRATRGARIRRTAEFARRALPAITPAALQLGGDRLAEQARIPSSAWKVAREAATKGPVLVQVSRAGRRDGRRVDPHRRRSRAGVPDDADRRLRRRAAGARRARDAGARRRDPRRRARRRRRISRGAPARRRPDARERIDARRRGLSSLVVECGRARRAGRADRTRRRRGRPRAVVRDLAAGRVRRVGARRAASAPTAAGRPDRDAQRDDRRDRDGGRVDRRPAGGRDRPVPDAGRGPSGRRSDSTTTSALRSRRRCVPRSFDAPQGRRPLKGERPRRAALELRVRMDDPQPYIGA